VSLEHLWYGQKPSLIEKGLSLLLTPLNWLFGVIVKQRISTHNSKPTRKYDVPVVVVGNITVGGTGKTPMIQWLCRQLQAEGVSVGIVSRGYGGKSTQYPLSVTPLISPRESGDEPALLARSLNCPVVVGPDRDKAVRFLIQQFEVDLILSDDGLQHYKMHRDVEIVMLDAGRGIGNGRLLPLGPLREPLSRLHSVDFVFAKQAPFQPVHDSLSQLNKIVYLPQINAELMAKTHAEPLIQGQTVHAFVGIANPEPFFTALEKQGFTLERHVFGDHYDFDESDFNGLTNYPIIMTDKDWVKCESLVQNCHSVWVLPVSYDVPDDICTDIIKKLKSMINPH